MCGRVHLVHAWLRCCHKSMPYAHGQIPMSDFPWGGSPHEDVTKGPPNGTFSLGFSLFPIGYQIPKGAYSHMGAGWARFYGN